VIFNRDGSRAYASQMETASLYEVDTATRKVRRWLHVNGSWTKVLALSPDERSIYAANWSSNDVSEIDLATWTVRRVIKTVRTPRGLYPTPDGRRLYVAGYGNGEIQRIELASGRGRVLLRTGGAMRHLVGDGKTLYANDMARARVYAVDLKTERVRELARTDQKPNTMDLSPDGRLLFISNRGANNPRSYYLPGPEWGSVLVLDTRTGRVLDAIVGGNQTTGLDVSNDGRQLAFSDFLDNRIRVYLVPPYPVLARGGGGRARAYRAELAK
jgi:YVTN family beta-propeller protein